MIFCYLFTKGNLGTRSLNNYGIICEFFPNGVPDTPGVIVTTYNHNQHHHHHLTLGLKCSSRDHQAFHPQLPSSTPASTSSPTATLCCSGGGEEAREQVPSQETESSTFFNPLTHFVSQPMARVRNKRNIVLFIQIDVYCLRLHLNIVSFFHSTPGSRSLYFLAF